MTLERYVDWLARGRSHQADGRVIDAMLCYRRALREAADGVDARFHLGEIAWHLGSQAEAIAAWQVAVERSPNHVPSLHALADAFASMGQFDAARAHVGRVLSLRPAEPRATALAHLLRMASGEAIEDAALATAIRLDRRWALALLGPVGARVLQKHEHYTQSVSAVLDGIFALAITSGSEDHLRYLALAASEAGFCEHAEHLADRYAQSCRDFHGPGMPLLWPLRTAGRGVRAGMIVADDDARSEARSIADVVRRSGEGARFTLFAASAQSAKPEGDFIDLRLLPADADAAARGIALLDLDVLIDLAGLRIPTGPILARRVARAVWLMPHDAFPVARKLGDRVIARDAPESTASLVEALEALAVAVSHRAGCDMTAAELAARWDAAVHAHEHGETSVAIRGYDELLHVQPDFSPALYLRGLLARSQGDVATAREQLRAAVACAPDFVDARAALADIEMMNGDAGAAAHIATRGLERASDSALLWRTLGRARLKEEDAHAALQAFNEALKRDVTHGETHYNHGVALQMARQSGEATRAYQRALAFQPDLYAADFNLGVIFDQQGNTAGAIAAFSKVLERAPTNAGAYKALAETLFTSGRLDAWFANFERFEMHCPKHAALAVNALEVCAHRADFSRLDAYLAGLRDGRFSEGEPQEVLDALQQILYLLHFFDVEPALFGRLAATHDALARRMYGEPRPPGATRKPGRVRIGYISGDFRNHVMGKMMYEALRHHDRDRFDLYAYSTSGVRDAWTDRYESLVGTLNVIEALSDSDAVRRIGEDDLDVLVDLSTHTKGARPGILALKPARVQITHVASAGTLGMSAIDYKLTDRYADVGHDPEMQIEPLLVMDGCVYPYRHVAPVANLYTRKQAGIAAEAIVIGAFVTPLKLSQRCLELWRDVLRRLPKAVIAFSPVQPALRTVLQQICHTVGIERQRIAFLPQGRDDGENQSRYALVDFVLDPLPHGGVNGTLEALDMGVPVVTLVGRRHEERTSYSILANLGVMDTIAHTRGEYVDIAFRLASDREFMRTVKERIHRALAASMLTDMRGHTRNLERAYIAAIAARAPGVLEHDRHEARAIG